MFKKVKILLIIKMIIFKFIYVGLKVRVFKFFILSVKTTKIR